MEAVKKRYETQKKTKISDYMHWKNEYIQYYTFQYVHVCMCTLAYNDFSYPEISVIRTPSGPNLSG